VGADREELRQWFEREDAYQDYRRKKIQWQRTGRHRLPDADEFEPDDTPSFRHPSLNRHGR